jgi:hypothetical protein
MATTLSIGPEQQRLEGRTVRDIVEHDPAQVNEVWCRKIFRQLLQSLELQYAMRMPHRAITPDTVVFHDNGEPLLLPTAVDEAEPDEAADLTALARLVHFAITRELAPSGPLHGRQLEGYSDSLVTAVDRCMYGDPAERPRSIDELRHILGIVSLGPAAPAAAPVPTPAAAPLAMPADAPAALTRPVTVPLDAPFAATGSDVKIMSAAAPAAPAASAPSAPSAAFAASAADPLPSFMHNPGARTRAGGLSRWQRWAIAGGGGAVLLAVALALFAELRDSGSYDHIVLTLPQSGAHSDAHSDAHPDEQSHEQARSDAASVPAPLAQAELEGAADARVPVPAQDGDAIAAMAAQREAAQQQQQPQPAPALAARAPVLAAAPANRTAAPGPARSATYKLQIQPWGVVYVDGVDRGVSPPVKRLVLTPGRHTIRIANPNFHDRVLEVDTSAGSGQIAVDFSDEPR